MEAPCCYGSEKRVQPVDIVFFPEAQPVEVPEKMCDVVVLLCVTDQTCRCTADGPAGDREDQPGSHCHNQVASWSMTWPVTKVPADWPVYGYLGVGGGRRYSLRQPLRYDFSWIGHCRCIFPSSARTSPAVRIVSEPMTRGMFGRYSYWHIQNGKIHSVTSRAVDIIHSS